MTNVNIIGLKAFLAKGNTLGYPIDDFQTTFFRTILPISIKLDIKRPSVKKVKIWLNEEPCSFQREKNKVMAKIHWRHRINLIFRNTRSISKLFKLSLSIFCKRDLNSVQMKGPDLFQGKMIAEVDHTLTTFRCIEIINRRQYSVQIQKTFVYNIGQQFYKHVQHEWDHVLTIFDYIPGRQHGFYLISPQRSFQISAICQPFYGSNNSLSYRPSRTYSSSRKINHWEP